MIYLEERLNKEVHFEITGNFLCGADNPLNRFLSDDSFEYDEEKFGSTYLLLNENKKQVLAFYTIKANGVQLYNRKKNYYFSAPVVEISRIAVEYELQNQGFGKVLFYDYILPKIRDVGNKIAVKALSVFVEPDNLQGISFYKSLGFEKAVKEVCQKISETFNEDCDLYILEL